jgi:hypothetical protein
VSVQAFTYVLLVGAAALALWIVVRFTRFGPQSLLWAGVHVVISYSLLRLTPVFVGAIEGDGMARRIGVVLGVALPLFVYTFLSGAWVTRAAMGLLRR